MGNTWVSTADPSLSAGAPLALLPGAAVALAVLAGAAVPGEPPQPATRAAPMLAPRQAHSARRAPAPPLVIGAENSPARAQPRAAGDPHGPGPRHLLPRPRSRPSEGMLRGQLSLARGRRSQAEVWSCQRSPSKT